jgi:hypothetical protein
MAPLADRALGAFRDVVPRLGGAFALQHRGATVAFLPPSPSALLVRDVLEGGLADVVSAHRQYLAGRAWLGAAGCRLWRDREGWE